MDLFSVVVVLLTVFLYPASVFPPISASSSQFNVVGVKELSGV